MITVNQYKNYNNIVNFRSRNQNDFDLKDISKKYFEQNPPPTDITNIGVHGSSSTVEIKPHSDIDFFCLCKTQNKDSIEYLRKFVEHINKSTHRWVDMMVGNLENKDAFKLNDFVLNDILQNSSSLYGNNLEHNVNTMLKNYKGEDSIHYLFKELQSSGHRIKRAVVDMNEFQPLITKPPISMDCIKVNGVEAKSKTIARQILSSCAFANTLSDYISGRTPKFSKKDAPEDFEKLFKIKTNLPTKAKEIYYEDESKINLEKFANEEAIDWLEIQEVVEKIIKQKIKIYDRTKFIRTIKNLVLQRK